MKKWKMSLLIGFLLLSTALLSGEVNHAYADYDNADSQNENIDGFGYVEVMIWNDWLSDGPGYTNKMQSVPVIVHMNVESITDPHGQSEPEEEEEEAIPEEDEDELAGWAEVIIWGEWELESSVGWQKTQSAPVVVHMNVESNTDPISPLHGGPPSEPEEEEEVVIPEEDEEESPILESVPSQDDDELDEEEEVQTKPITDRGWGLILDEEVYTALNTTLISPGITMFQHALVEWTINATLYPYPDCSVEIWIDEEVLGGFSNACILGNCSVTPLPPHPSGSYVIFIPYGEGYGLFDLADTGYEGGYYAHISLLLFGEARPKLCDYHGFMP